MRKRMMQTYVTTLILLPLALVSLGLLALNHITPVQAGMQTDPQTIANISLRNNTTTLGTSAIQTWTHNTRADWIAGTQVALDSTAISGSLQLAKRIFSDDEPVSTNAGTNQVEPVIVSHPNQSNTLYAAWIDSRDWNQDIYVAHSTDGGTTWSAGVKVNDDTGNAAQYEPTIAIGSDGTLYLAWVDERNGNPDIYVARSNDNGTTWSTNVRADDDKTMSTQSEPSLIYDNDNTLYLTWRDQRNVDEGDIYFARSVDGGSTWSLSVRANDFRSPVALNSPKLASDGKGTLYLAFGVASRYMDDCDTGNVFVTQSTDGGRSWADNSRVNNTPLWVMDSDPHNVALAVGASDKLHVAWQARDCNGGFLGHMYTTYSENGGTTWAPPTKVNSSYAAFGPSLAADAGTVYLTWSDYTDASTRHVCLARSLDGGKNWEAGVQIDEGAEATDPNLAVGVDNEVHVIWNDRRYDNDIYTSKSSDNGATWSPNIQVDDGPGQGDQINPDLAVDSNKTLYLAWLDGRSGDDDIYFTMRFTDDNWQAGEKVNDDSSTTDQYQPSIAVDGTGNAYILWGDQRNGYGDIYFAHRAAISTTWGNNIRVNDDVAGISWQSDPDIAVDSNGNAYAVWHDWRNGSTDGDIYFAYRAAISNTWGSNVKVNDNTGSMRRPAIAVDDNSNAYAVWTDSSSGDLYFAYRTAVSTTWSSNVRVNDTPGTVYGSWSPALTVDDTGNAYVVWVGWHDNKREEYKTYFATRPADESWSPGVNINDNSGIVSQRNRDITVGEDGNVYVIWHNRDKNMSYFAFRPAGGDWASTMPIKKGDWDNGSYNSIVVNNEDFAYIVGNGLRFAKSLPTSEYRPKGYYTSSELDAGTVATWKSLTYSGTVPPGTSLSFETRSRTAGGNWSEWTTVSSAITSPVGQYLQYGVNFSTVATDTTPRLDQVQISYQSAGKPSAPRFITPSGITNQTTPTLKGSAVAGSIVYLYVDGSQVATTTANTDGAFTFAPSLSTGDHTITTTAENDSGTSLASTPLSLNVDTSLPYDPVGVRAGQWSKDGWLFSPPRDGSWDANPNNNWRIWPRTDQKFRVQVPVSYTTSAAVTVTVGTQTITLTEVTLGTFVGTFQPPIHSGDFIIQVNADGKSTTVTGGPVLIDPDGFVYEAGGKISDTISGVEVTCYYSDTYSGQWVMWDAWNYEDQVNPQITLNDGYYSFYTPRGVYRVVAKKEGYPIYISQDLVVVDTPIRHNIPLGDADFSVGIAKSVSPTSQVKYGNELTYTLVISAEKGTQMALYDRLRNTTFKRFVQPTAGITSTSDTITGTLTVTPTSQITVGFVVEVGVPSTVGCPVNVTNTACVYPIGGMIEEDCVWSKEVATIAFRPYSVYLPLALRNH